MGEELVKNKGRIWTGLFIALILVSLTVSLVLQALSNVTPLYVDAMSGAATVSGFLATVFSISGGVGRIAGGYLADANGRRKTMVIGMFTLLIGALLPAPVYSVPLLIIARALQGIGFAMTATAAGSAVADILPQDKMGEGIGYYALGQSIASALGPALGIWLASGGDFKLVFGVLGAVAAVGIILSATCNYERKPEYQDVRIAREEAAASKAPFYTRLFDINALPAGVMNLTMGLGFAAYLHFLALYGKSLHITNIGTFFTVSAVVMLLSRIFLSKYIYRESPKLIITVAMITGFISFMIVAFLPKTFLLYIAGALYGFCFGVMMPMCNVLAVKNAPANKRGAATATCYIGADLGMGIGGALCGLIIDHIGLQSLYIINSGWMIITIIIAWVMIRDKKKNMLSAKI